MKKQLDTTLEDCSIKSYNTSSQGDLSQVKLKNKSRRWKHAKPDLMTNCFLCAEQFSIKYILPRQQYSQKNNWGYWTGKKVFQNQHVCDNCLIKIHQGGISKWVNNSEKADIFYTYLSRKTVRKD